MSYQSLPALGDVTVTGTLGSLTDDISLECNGVSGAKAVISGTWVGTVKFQQTIDGVRWDNVGTFSGTTGAILSATGTTTNDIVVFVGIAGIAKIRAIFTAYTSGTASITLRASNGVSNVYVDNLLPNNLKNLSYTADGTGNLISSASGRLHVDAQITSTVPTSYAVPFFSYCTNGGSSSMAVNGSVTPVSFDYAPTSGQTPQYITAIKFLLSDNGSPTLTTFGIITALTNGVQILVKTNGTEYEIGNMKNNGDISLVFAENAQQGTGGLLADDTYSGVYTFLQPLILASTSDYIRFKVRDNLTAIDGIRSAVKGYRIP